MSDELDNGGADNPAPREADRGELVEVPLFDVLDDDYPYTKRRQPVDRY